MADDEQGVPFFDILYSFDFVQFLYGIVETAISDFGFAANCLRDESAVAVPGRLGLRIITLLFSAA